MRTFARLLSLTICISLGFICLCHAKELLPEGNFKYAPAGELPPKWGFPESPYWQPDKRDGDVTEAIRAEQGSTLLLENKSAKNGLKIQSEMKPVGDLKKLILRSSFRMSNLVPGNKRWQVGVIELDFYDQEQNFIKLYNKINITEDCEWTNRSIAITVPPKAVSWRVIAGFTSAGGRLEISNISLEDETVETVETVNNFERFWNKEPVEVLSSLRERILLNGYWRFTPLDTSLKEKAASGYIYVPGTWYRGHSWLRPALGGVASFPQDKSWDEGSLKNCFLATYQRPINIPSSWAGRAIKLKIEDVCTDAEIFVDGQRAGVIGWPGGELDITEFVNPGKRQHLVVNVLAKSDREFVENFVNYDGKKEKAIVYNRGITGTVSLASFPKEIIIASPFIKTSVRNKSITFDLSLEGKAISQDLPVNFSFKIYDADGTLVKEDSDQISEYKQGTPLSFTYKWESPKLWDYLQPNLYYAVIGAQIGKASDEIKQRFGFREIRIDGREILLNEKPFRFKVSQVPSIRIGGMPSMLKRVMNNIIDSNFNLIELSTYVDPRQRGTVNFRKEWAMAADEMGLPVIMPALTFNSYIPWGSLGSDKAFADLEKDMAADWNDLRNHPSVLFMMCGFNRFSYFDDQSPYKLGNGKVLYDHADESYRKIADMGGHIMDIMRRVDGTRPTVSHQSSSVGDMHLINLYLNLTPLQEREEWLRVWAKNGDRPFTAVEFGCPITYTLMRGREGGCSTVSFSEPLVTEYCAIYFGDDAYVQEIPEYRQSVRKHWKSTRKYSTWHGADEIRFSPVTAQLLQLFNKNTWRSWRSWGMTGGVNPWENSCGWKNYMKGQIETEPFKPYTDQPYTPFIDKRFYYCYDKSVRNATGDALVALNSPVMAWIAGNTDNFTEKSHNFRSGQTVKKQAVLINDNRNDASFSLECTAFVNGQKCFSFANEGTINSGQNLFIPFEFVLPLECGSGEGRIEMTVSIGKEKCTDTFELNIIQSLNASQSIVDVYDHFEKSCDKLKSLGFSVRPWDGSGKPVGDTLIVGADMLADQNFPMQAIETFVKDGGRVVFLENSPEILRNKLGFRASRQVSRRAYPVTTMKGNPVCVGFDKEKLRDWQGRGSTIPETAHVELDKTGTNGVPMYGYHWGNTGSVASTMIEKPHCSSFSPIFEGEFGLAYSPLMEMRYGKGLVLLNTFDLINRDIADPVADNLLCRLVNYALDHQDMGETVRTLPTYYIGDDVDCAFLNKLQLDFKRVTEIPSEPSLLIVGRNTDIDEEKLDAFITSGGNALFLPISKSNFLGFTIASGTYEKNGDVPDWEVCKGLSLSDFYLKVDFDCNLLQNGANDIELQGALGRYRKGDGTAVIFQILPDLLNSDKFDYYRFSSWRLTRALCQIIANMGGTFAADRKFFQLREMNAGEIRIQLPLTWKAEFEKKITAEKDDTRHDNRLDDSDNIGLRSGWNTIEFDDSKWHDLNVGGYWEMQGDYWVGTNGVVWARGKVNIPADWKGKQLVLNLGKIDDMDTTYFNGKEVGRTNDQTSKTYWGDQRVYLIDNKLINYGGENQIAVRIFDNFGNGGFYSPVDQLHIAPVTEKELQIYDNYVSGFRDDYCDGDDPYRYIRW